MRIAKEIEIEGKKARALFDTGSMHTYVSRWLLEGVPIRTLSQPYRVALGGKVIDVREHCSVQATIEGLGFHTEVIPYGHDHHHYGSQPNHRPVAARPFPCSFDQGRTPGLDGLVLQESPQVVGEPLSSAVTALRLLGGGLQDDRF